MVIADIGVDIDHLFAMPVLLEYIRKHFPDGDKLTIVSPDAGGVERARAYAKRLRKLRAETAEALASGAGARVATVHDGYAYLLQEFGIRVAHVVQPKHGIEPSANELAASVESLRSSGVAVLFAERGLAQAYVDDLAREASVRVARLGHIGPGGFTPGRFEEEMRANCQVLVDALAPR